MQLTILHEDDALLFVDKPPGVVVQRGHDPDEPVLFEEAERYLRSKGEEAYLLQRLDRGTSGVLFFSKRSDLNARLTRMFETRQVRKSYLALVHGIVGEPRTIDAPITRVGPISFGVRAEGKRAVTHVEPVVTGRAATLLRVRLETGRTHQIRVHCAWAGFPLIGDWLYGDRDAARPMLHSSTLTMPHPERLGPLHVAAPLPVDFKSEAEHRLGAPIEQA